MLAQFTEPHLESQESVSDTFSSPDIVLTFRKAKVEDADVTTALHQALAKQAQAGMVHNRAKVTEDREEPDLSGR